jgi:hypothetical protein
MFFSRSLLFLNILNTNRFVANLMRFRIEGRNYIKKDDTHIDFAKGIDPKAIAKFKANGLDKVIAEEQKQYDVWLKTKK